MKQFRDTYYYVSKEGKVFSNYRNNMKEMKLRKDKYGYVRTGLIINKKQRFVQIHRIIAECFLEDYSENLQVNHKNRIKTDNNINNLEMISQKENIHHYYKSKDKDWKPQTIEYKKEYKKKYDKEYRKSDKFKEYKRSDKFKKHYNNYMKIYREKIKNNKCI